MTDSLPETQRTGKAGVWRIGAVSELVKGVGNSNVKKIRLKHNETFIVTDANGDFLLSEREMGLYRQATRYLRTCNLLLQGYPLLPLAYTLSDQGDSCEIDLTNPQLSLGDARLESNTLFVRRCLELQSNSLTQSIELSSYQFTPLTLELRLAVKADFFDIFEVRGWPREKRGHIYPPQISRDSITFRYRGLDNVERNTVLTLTPRADSIDDEGISWKIELSKDQSMGIHIAISMQEYNAPHITRTAEIAGANKTVSSETLLDRPLPETHTNNEEFDQLLKRGIDDLLLLCTMTPQGIYPYGGIPSYVCPFGRDALITSLQFLPWLPEVARGTLAFLAAHQGKRIDLYTEEEPGKILHEFRYGELANNHEIPFAPYYGTIDATPEFLITFEAYLRWTNDLAFLEQLWPQVEAAAQWMGDYGDKDKDTFLEYCSTSHRGLINQGWKDSSAEVISHRDGSLAAAPIALCEVQGYAYAAYYAMSYLASRLGKVEEAAHWSRVAKTLQENFLNRFWWEDESILYLALDGAKQPCEVVSSNAGQCLWTGIVPDGLAQRIAARLLCEDMYSGWGIRTLSEHAARYNPISYHNGSVWPHDTAIIGAGLVRYGRRAEAGQLLERLVEASQFFERARLPEVFCGFARSHARGPVPYPTACEPQSWAAGAPFLLLSAMLGLEPDAEHHRLALRQPTLPDFLETIELRGLRLGEDEVNLRLERSGKNSLAAITNETSVELEIVP